MINGTDIKELRNFYYQVKSREDKGKWDNLSFTEKLEDFRDEISPNETSKKISIHTIRNWEKQKNLQKKIPKKYHSNIIALRDSLYHNEHINMDENKKKVDEGFVDKVLSHFGSKIVRGFLDNVVAMYCYCKDPNMPIGKKAILYAALAYFIMPLDVVPDYIPLSGFIDDGFMIAGALKTIGELPKKHREEAEKYINSWFGRK